MTILVTGGAGYIGSHTCIELVQQGHDIVIIDNLSNSSIQAIKKIEIITKSSLFFIDGDVRDEILLSEVFNKFEITSVIPVSYTHLTLPTN